jgi:hypothetical protein
MAKEMITQERLKELLDYNPETGIFTWRGYRRGTRPGVTRAGTPSYKGYGCQGFYWRIGVDGRYYLASRLAWLYMTGKWPTQLIDHKDGDSSNDAFSNLREASRRQNSQNLLRPHRGNKSGFLGVTRGVNNRWIATIRIGSYASPEEAYAAYVAAKRHLHEFGQL